MSTFNPRKFTDPDWLATIAPKRLVAFLTPWSDDLSRRGFHLPPAAGVQALDCQGLAQVLMAPDAGTPPAMVDALYFVHETAALDDLEALLQVAAARGLKLEDDPAATPADVAIDIWMADATLLQTRHAEALARRQQTFDYYAGTAGGPRRFPDLDDETRQRIEDVFDDWFEAHRRGRGSHLLVFRHAPLVWLLVRHGLVMRREASHGDDGGAGTAFYRPQRHDVLVYDEQTDEIGVHAGTQGERKLYLRTLGAHLFGDERYFPSGPRFTLEPLAKEGAGSLACADVPGIDAIRLVEYRLFWGGAHKESEIRRATDIFAAAAARGDARAIRKAPSAATFKVQFTGIRKERSVTIRIPASARYERNEDGEIVEQWLRERGFLVRRSGPKAGLDDEDTPAVLERA